MLCKLVLCACQYAVQVSAMCMSICCAWQYAVQVSAMCMSICYACQYDVQITMNQIDWQVGIQWDNLRKI
jgi:hypothetical protein